MPSTLEPAPTPGCAGPLHVLTPVGSPSIASLIDAGTFNDASRHTQEGLVADLRTFPPTAHHIVDNAAIDITPGLVPERDYWAVAHRWLSGVTAVAGLQDALAINLGPGTPAYGFWWTLNGQKFIPSLSEFGNAFSWIDLLTALCRQHAPHTLVVHGRHATILHIVTQVCPEAHVEVRDETPPSPPRRRISLRSAGLLAARLLTGVAYLLSSLFRRPHVAVFSITTLMRPAGDGNQLRDVYLGDIADALCARGWRTVLIEKHEPNASWAAFRARLRNGPYFPNDLLFLISHPALQRHGPYRSLFPKWAARWQAARSGVAPHLTYHGCDLAPLLLPLIAREFTEHAPNLEIMARAWRAILRLWRPRLLYINNSYSRSALPAIVAAKSLGIPTVEQQHGVMNRDHIPYLVPHAAAIESEFPLCAYFVVWGDYFKRLLVNAGVYPANRVTVTGFPRIDALLGQLPSRRDTLAALAIPPGARIVLYTSNEIAAAFRSAIIDGIAESQDPDLYWIVKLHPRETGRADWSTSLSERGLNRVRIVQREIDFYALLAACDVHASFTSTTLVEAAILGKLNLGLDVAGVPDPVGYVDAGAFLPVAPQELGPVTEQVLNDPDLWQRLAAEQRAFARDWCLHDGRAVERIVALLESLIKEGEPHA